MIAYNANKRVWFILYCVTVANIENFVKCFYMLLTQIASSVKSEPIVSEIEANDKQALQCKSISSRSNSLKFDIK